MRWPSDGSRDHFMDGRDRLEKGTAQDSLKPEYPFLCPLFGGREASKLGHLGGIEPLD